MNKTVKARLNWMPEEDGGKKSPLPIGMRYCPIIVFDSVQTDKSLWSAVVYNTTIDGRVSVAEVSYLADDAPHHELHTGRKFLLYEGQRVVAEGEIS